MMHHTETAPVMACRFAGGSRSVPAIVSSLLGAEGLSCTLDSPTPEMLEILGLALNEVLHSVTEFAGEQTIADDAKVELWAEETLVIICIKFHGRSLPHWLLQNWDRAQEPAVLAPKSDIGWGWLLVREALDSVNHAWRDSTQLLFLERRI